MKCVRYSILAIALAFVASQASRADDAAERAVINKAIKAHLGDTEAAKIAAASVRLKGTIHAMGMKVPFSGEAISFGPDRQKIDLEVEAGGMKFRITNVVDGKKGWAKFDKEVKVLDKEELAEAQQQMYVNWIAGVAPLKGKEFTLSSIGEVMIEKKPAIGVKVACKDRRDVDMYFDKETGLLVKTEARVKDDSGQEVVEETFYSDYKDVQGTKQPMKFLVNRDGKVFMEAEATDYTLAEKFEDSVFAKP